MSTPALLDKGDEEAPEDQPFFLSDPPRSGELSPFAQKLAAEAFVWLCSIVVFGSAADFASQLECSSLCRFNIAAGVISFAFTSLVLLGHYLTWSNRIDRSSWFTSLAEMRFMFFLAVWWIFGVAVASAFTIPVHSAEITIAFSWLCFVGSIFGAYKAYHAAKEELTSIRHAQILSNRATEEEEYANFS